MGDENVDDTLKRKALTEKFFGPNLGYVLEQFEKFQQDPHSVEDDMKVFFMELENANTMEETSQRSEAAHKVAEVSLPIEKILAAAKLAEHIRGFGHLS